MNGHRFSIMRNENAALVGRPSQNLLVKLADHATLVGAPYFNRRLFAAKRKKDLMIEVRIRLEARPHGPERWPVCLDSASLA